MEALHRREINITAGQTYTRTDVQYRVMQTSINVKYFKRNKFLKLYSGHSSRQMACRKVNSKIV